MKPPLPLGTVVGTPAAIAEMEKAGISPAFLLARHRNHDWGDVDSTDWKLNDVAIRDGSRILSAYNLPLTGIRLWVITEAQDDDGIRQSTCLLLPTEY